MQILRRVSVDALVFPVDAYSQLHASRVMKGHSDSTSRACTLVYVATTILSAK